MVNVPPYKTDHGISIIISISVSIKWISPPGPSPYHGEEVCVPQWLGELCWQKRKLQIQSPMPDRAKGRGQIKCSPWTWIPPWKNFLLWNHGGDRDPHRVVAPVKKKI
jgi:hypothetical protein